MSTAERFEGPTYLNTPRINFEQLTEVVSQEAEAVRTQAEEGRDVSPVEWSMVAAGVDDIEIWNRIYTWANGNTIPFNPAQMVKDPVYLRKQSYRMIQGNYKYLLKSNKDELSDPDKTDRVLGALATLGSTRAESERYSEWKLTHFELWARVSPHIANLPVSHSFLINRDRPRKGPDAAVAFEAMKRAALTSFVLRSIWSVMLERSDPDSSFARKIHSLQGIIAELDGLIFLNESEADFHSNNLWHFPASPNMDICAANQQKCDLFTIEFPNDKETPPQLYLYDVKMRDYKPSPRPQAAGVNLLGANILGNHLVKDGQIIRQAGVLADRFIDENAELMPATTDNTSELLAHGFTGMHMDLKAMMNYVLRQKQVR